MATNPQRPDSCSRCDVPNTRDYLVQCHLCQEWICNDDTDDGEVEYFDPDGKLDCAILTCCICDDTLGCGKCVSICLLCNAHHCQKDECVKLSCIPERVPRTWLLGVPNKCAHCERICETSVQCVGCTQAFCQGEDTKHDVQSCDKCTTKSVSAPCHLCCILHCAGCKQQLGCNECAKDATLCSCWVPHCNLVMCVQSVCAKQTHKKRRFDEL